MGTSNRAVGDPYDAQVMGAITQNYNLPAGMTPDQIAQPPEIQFKVTADGTLAGVKLIKSSGNPLVDDACVSAAAADAQGAAAARGPRRAPTPSPAGSNRRLGVRVI